MKKLGLFGKLFYAVNLVVALALFFSFLLPFVPPASFPVISVLSLLVSPLIVVNLVFVIYWLLRFNRRFLLSFFVLAISFFYFNSFYQFSTTKKGTLGKKLSVVSYNVRLFNAYEKKPSVSATEIIKAIIQDVAPDVLCIQEYYADNDVDFSFYKYKYIHFEGAHKLGHAIFSNYKLINTGAFDFKNSNNNALYADVIVDKDTMRLYNLHLQSLGINPSVSSIQEGNKEKLVRRIAGSFKKQQEQVQEVLTHKQSSPYPVILTGDFNNTSFSYIYKQLNSAMQDAFIEAGSGLGTTFYFDWYPMRIDYIFTSLEFTILDFKTLKQTSSDHHPIYAEVEW